MPTKKLLQITFIAVIIGILFSLSTSVLILLKISSPAFLTTTHLLVSALVSGLVFTVLYHYFDFIQLDQAKQSSLVVGGCFVIMNILKAFNLYSNKIVVIIIGVFFAISYIFWVVVVLKQKSRSKAYKHIKAFIISTITLVVLLALYPIILGASALHNPTSESTQSYLFPAISTVLYQIPWIFYILFLKEIPNEPEKGTSNHFQEEGIIDAHLD